MPLNADKIKNIALKTLIKKSEQYCGILCDLKSWHDDYKPEKGEAVLTEVKNYKTKHHTVLCAGLQHLTVETETAHNPKQNEIGKIVKCLRQMSTQLGKFEKFKAVKKYCTITNPLCCGLDVLLKDTAAVDVFCGKNVTHGPARTPQSSSHISDAQERSPPDHGAMGIKGRNLPGKPMNVKNKRPTSAKKKVKHEKQENCPTCTTNLKVLETQKIKICSLEKRETDIKKKCETLKEQNDYLTAELAMQQECLDKLNMPEEQKTLLSSFTSDKLLMTKDDKIKSMKVDFEAELEYRDEKIAQMREEIASLTTRLSAEMSKKMSGDESSVENISIRNRPLNIAEDYYNFCSNAWLDAKTTLDEQCAKVPEELALKFLNDVLLRAYKLTGDAYQEVFQTFQMQIQQPGGAVLPEKSKPNRKPGELPTEITVVMGDYMRVISGKTDTSALTKVIMENLLKEKSPFNKVLRETSISAYIEECSLIGWKMAIQRPAMEFRCDGVDKAWLEMSQEPYWRCDPYKEGATVKYYIHPALYHGGGLLVKGKVYID